MNGRSGLVTFFLFLFLLVMIVLQFLSMMVPERGTDHTLWHINLE